MEREKIVCMILIGVALLKPIGIGMTEIVAALIVPSILAVREVMGQS